MKRMLQFIIGHSRAAALFITLVLSVSMMLMGDGSKSGFARSVTTGIFNTGHFTFSWGIYILDLWRENKRLRFRNLELSDRISRQNTAIRENERLKRLLGLKLSLPMSERAIAAMVLGHDFDRVVNMLIVDAGERDGIRKNMSVVTAEGLVGKVFQVYSTSSSIQIIMDMNARVSAESVGIRGIMRWEGGPYLRMFGLPLSTIPQEGEPVYTTGFGVYPAGIFVGTVRGRRLDDVERFASVYVEPGVDFSAVHEVFIIRGTERSDVWDDGDGSGGFERPNIE